ncbi:MAG TPA: pitrilysin family protein [Gemmatimonadales bacterium]|nr:pitrilysin family protein [Gemmatimonadales bacterium]
MPHDETDLVMRTSPLLTPAAALLALAAGLPRPAPAQSPLARVMHRTTLDNGLQVIVVDNSAVPLATALVAVHNGAFTQDSAEAGLAHLYEHLLFHSFRGNPAAFATETFRLNGVYNGTTSAEVVTYFVVVPSKNIESGIRLLADLLRKARFSNSDLKNERPVVLDELQRGESDPEQELERQVERKLWGPAWHRKDVGGDSASIQAISLDRLKATYARYYVPNNAALIVTGDVTQERIVQAAQRHFGEWQAGPDPFADQPIPPIPPRTGTAAVLLARDVLDVTIVIALHGPSVGVDPGATYAADVLFDVFNDPGSAFQRRLVDGGPFRSISGHYLTLDHTGPIQIQGKTTPQRAQEAVLALLAELDNLDQLEGVTDDDLGIAKKRRQVGTALMLERTASLAPNLAFWWSAAGMEYYLSYHDRMAAQTADDLRRFARTYVVEQPRVIGVLGAPRVVDHLATWLRQGGRRPSP